MSHFSSLVVVVWFVIVLFEPKSIHLFLQKKCCVLNMALYNPIRVIQTSVSLYRVVLSTFWEKKAGKPFYSTTVEYCRFFFECKPKAALTKKFEKKYKKV